jgi:toxin YoeB
MIKQWTDRAWENYLYWQTQDKKMLKRVNQLIKDIERNGYAGMGKPELLKGDLAGWWSRRIDDRNRIVYRLKEDGTIEISQCKGHYND